MLYQQQDRNRFLVIDDSERRYQQLLSIMSHEQLLDTGNFSLDLAQDIDDALDRLYGMDYKVCFIDEHFCGANGQPGGLKALRSFKQHQLQTPTVLLVDSDHLEFEPETIHWLESGLVRILPGKTLCWTDVYHSIVDLLQRRASVLVVNRFEDQYFFIADTLVRYPDLSFSPDWARNIDEAIDKLMNHRFDMLILDQDLGMDKGTDLLVKLDHMGFSIPSILCTGRDRIALDEQALRLLGRRQVQFISRSRVTQEGSALPLLCARQLHLQ